MPFSEKSCHLSMHTVFWLCANFGERKLHGSRAREVMHVCHADMHLWFDVDTCEVLNHYVKLMKHIWKLDPYVVYSLDIKKKIKCFVPRGDSAKRFDFFGCLTSISCSSEKGVPVCLFWFLMK